MSDALLSLRNLRKRFGGLAVTDGVSLDVTPGEIHAVIGPNGAGKTTLINEIGGVLPLDSGQILFEGRDITALSMPRRARLGLARSFQITSVIPAFTALENVALAVQAGAGSSFRFLRPASSEQKLNAPAMAAERGVGVRFTAREVEDNNRSNMPRWIASLEVVQLIEPVIPGLDEVGGR
jgi:branched-chain amino acid transport system ATP-binding protein